MCRQGGPEAGARAGEILSCPANPGPGAGAVHNKAEGDPIDRIRAKADVPDRLRPLISDRWSELGNVLLIKFPDELIPHKKAVARAYAEELGAKAVLEDKGVEGELREPVVDVLYGTDTITTHLENGVRFRFDAARIMFSKGNTGERIRVPELVRDGEVVADMFAGIGYFTVPIAVHARPSRIIAAEKNPLSAMFLRENIALNKVRDGLVTVHEGDCLGLPEGVADRVLMGLIPSAAPFLEKAVRILSPKGGFLHFHETAREKEVPHVPFGKVRDAARAAGLGARLVGHRVVKSYAPCVLHVVVDVELGPGL